jgi:hypothetical protein
MGIFESLFGRKNDQQNRTIKKTTLPVSEPSSNTRQSAEINQVSTEQVQIADCMIKILNYYNVGMEKIHLDMMLNTLSSVEYFTHLGNNSKQYRNEYVSAFNYFLMGLSKPLPSPRLISLTQINREYYEIHIVEWKKLASLFKNLKMNDIAKVCMNVYDNGFIESWKNDWETFTYGLKRSEYLEEGELGNQQFPSNPSDSSTSLSRAEVVQRELEQMEKERLGK